MHHFMHFCKILQLFSPIQLFTSKYNTLMLREGDNSDMKDKGGT